MIIANIYNHLNAEEYLLCRKPNLYEEIKQCINRVDANQYLKISCDKSQIGKIYYSQSDINRTFKNYLNASGWIERIVHYYVTGDENTSRQVVNILDKNEQKQKINDNGFQAYPTYNQVDFQKDRAAIEVQFGKYFSVAYDLHVKHTFFYMRNEIDVGIEIIPTRALEQHMDTGVAWFENEVTNVIREGRTNPMVPILIIGIEPENIKSTDPQDLDGEELLRVIQNSDMGKFNDKAASLTNPSQIILDRIDRIQEAIRVGEDQDEH